jgi:acetolactate synthase-1/2/3 large subunit
MGPVYINVPIETTLQPWTPPRAPRKVVKAAPPQAPASEIERVAKLLLSAELPVVVTEGAGRQAEGYAALVELAELLAIPVIEPFPTEVANFPKTHPLHQGPTIQPFADETDLVLVVRSRVPWYPPRNKPRKATVVVLDETPVRDSMVYQNVPADITLEGDVVHSLRTLIAAVRARKPDAAKVTARRERCEATNAKRLAGNRRIDAEAAAKPIIDPAWLCHVLNEVLPQDTIVVDETITYRGSTIRHLDDHGPRSAFRVGGGLGQGFGTALGLKIASPQHLVAWIVGDGAFLYNPLPQSLAFAKHRDLPILILVLNNTGYDSMAKEHRAWYPDGISAKNDLFYGRTITDFDYAELAKPFGGFGRAVVKPADLKPALQEALAAVKSGKTAILNIMVERVETPR